MVGDRCFRRELKHNINDLEECFVAANAPWSVKEPAPAQCGDDEAIRPMTLATYLSYFMFVLVMVYSPGPMTIFLMENGTQRPYRQIYPILLGANHAYLLSIIVFSCGLARLLQEHIWLLRTVQAIGIVYLLFLACKQWVKPVTRESTVHVEPTIKTSALYAKGALIALSNPKTILLFGVVFPEFADSSGSYYWQIALLGATFLALQFSSGFFYAYFGKQIKSLLEQHQGARILNKVSAMMLFLVAGFLATKL